MYIHDGYSRTTGASATLGMGGAVEDASGSKRGLFFFQLSSLSESKPSAKRLLSPRRVDGYVDNVELSRKSSISGLDAGLTHQFTFLGSTVLQNGYIPIHFLTLRSSAQRHLVALPQFALLHVPNGSF